MNDRLEFARRRIVTLPGHIDMSYRFLISVLTIALLQQVAHGQHYRLRSATPDAQRAALEKKSIEEKTKVHRLTSTKRAAYDAFIYVNRIPNGAEEGESANDLAGRIFGRLANQEGRILLKLPRGMDRASYRGFKTFLRYEGKAKVGNCVACHTPPEFSDLKTHVVTKDGSPKPTLSLRNLKERNVDVRKAILDKIAASSQKRFGEADEIDDAYAVMDISLDDVRDLVAFLGLLNDVADEDFRGLILNATLLDTFTDLEEDTQKDADECSGLR